MQQGDSDPETWGPLPKLLKLSRRKQSQGEGKEKRRRKKRNQV